MQKTLKCTQFMVCIIECKTSHFIASYCVVRVHNLYNTQINFQSVEIKLNCSMHLLLLWTRENDRWLARCGWVDDEWRVILFKLAKEKWLLYAILIRRNKIRCNNRTFSHELQRLSVPAEQFYPNIIRYLYPIRETVRVRQDINDEKSKSS